MTLPLLQAPGNVLGRDVSRFVPGTDGLPGAVGMSAHHARIWELAAPHLRVRDNDAHTVYAYGLARALLTLHPEADAEVVLPGILLHDTGWSTVPEDQILEAITPDGGRPDLVLQHEREGARIAAEVLGAVGHDPDRTAHVVRIVDGHDSRRHALDLEDALVKDADKLWRVTPHGLDTVMRWFGLDRAAAHRLVLSRVHDHLLTDAGRTLAHGLSAVALVDTLPQRVALG